MLFTNKLLFIVKAGKMIYQMINILFSCIYYESFLNLHSSAYTEVM